MSKRQRRGRRAVADVLPEPRPQCGPRFVPYRRGGLVAADPTRVVEPPHKVDVLTQPQRLVETADGVEGLDADHPGRRRYVAQPRAGANTSGLAAEIERRCGLATYSGRDETDSGIIEMGEQWREPGTASQLIE